MRVSTGQLAGTALYGIGLAYERVSDAQSKLTTGKQLNKPSEDPAGVAQTLSFRNRLEEIEQFGRNIDQAHGFLSTSETALGSVASLLRQARSLAMQAANDAINDESRVALAAQVQAILRQVGEIGNANFGGRYVFAGQRTEKQPFVNQADGFLYQGGTAATGDADIQLDVDRNNTININISGEKVFTPILQALGELRTRIAYSNTAAISQEDLSALDKQISAVSAIRSDMGSKVQRLELTRSRNELSKINFTKFISDIEDADIPEAAVEFQLSQSALQAALQTTSRIFQTSLLDYLR